MGVTAGIFLASNLLKEMRYLVYIRYLYGSYQLQNCQPKTFLNFGIQILAIYTTIASKTGQILAYT
jgi:hypothetical protein